MRPNARGRESSERSKTIHRSSSITARASVTRDEPIHTNHLRAPIVHVTCIKHYKTSSTRLDYSHQPHDRAHVNPTPPSTSASIKLLIFP